MARRGSSPAHLVLNLYREMKALKRLRAGEKGGCENGCLVILGVISLVLIVLFLFFNKSPIPPNIQVGFRDSLLGRGKVVILTNRSGDHYYDVRVSVRTSNGRSASVIANRDLAPLGSCEVGWLELGNWVVEPGETVFVSTDSNPIPVVSNVPH
jgi:hypothetical protein